MLRGTIRFSLSVVFLFALAVESAHADAVDVLQIVRNGISGIARGGQGFDPLAAETGRERPSDPDTMPTATGVPALVKPVINDDVWNDDVVLPGGPTLGGAVTLGASGVVGTPSVLETDDVLDEILITADIPQLADVPDSQDDLTAVLIQNDLDNDTAMTPVPEPATAVLLATGLIVGALRKRLAMARM